MKQSTPLFTNQLIFESSPYLLQHAHNPVQWRAWNTESLQLAVKEDKPILISIGYSACHWCHVMERESFEDEETAKLMNAWFINIKVDREERPDLDHIYMEAVQALTGSGGWPLNVFLTPQGKPFYGGTYFPPERAFNRTSWKEVLKAIHNLFLEKRTEVENQANNLIGHIAKENIGTMLKLEYDDFFSKEHIENIAEKILQNADKQNGGFGNAPKFPQTFLIQFLLRHYFSTGNKESLQQALLSIDKMINGGIYDQLGGGFARYATDEEWLVPHFEKMLYDQALLLSVISEAYQITHNTRFKEVLEATLHFVQRELMHPDGGFYTALDADSENEEGKFYVWNFGEVQQILQKDTDIFCRFYDVSEKGNWEEKNILRRKKTVDEFIAEMEIDEKSFQRIILNGREKLFKLRQQRTRPTLDDKIILSWNALMNTALAKVFAATQNKDAKEMAIRNMAFLLEKFSKQENQGFHHSWKDGKATQPAFLDDHAFLIQALIQLHEITGEQEYLMKAKKITTDVLENFKDKDGCFFYFTHEQQLDCVVRKMEIYDGALPSGNAVMAQNLYQLSVYFDLLEWKKISYAAVSSLQRTIVAHPSSLGVWACLMQEFTEGTHEIVIAGDETEAIRNSILTNYIPYKTLMSGRGNKNIFPILVGKETAKSGEIFLCKNNTCKSPVSTVEQLLKLIANQT